MLCIFYTVLGAQKENFKRITTMASIAKLPGRRFWFAFYRDAAGRQHCKSTKLEHSPKPADASERTEQVGKNKRLATEIALRLEEAERGNVVESHLRKVLAEISERVNNQRLEFAVTRTFLNDWSDRAERTKSPATAVRYKGTIKKFLESLPKPIVDRPSAAGKVLPAGCQVRCCRRQRQPTRLSRR